MLGILKRPPDRVINDNYLLRWHIIPRNRFLNIYLHCFLGSDDDRALHDHPWWSVSFLLKGRIIEHTEDYGYQGQVIKLSRSVRRFIPKLRAAKHAHRIELTGDKAWTLFITGPKVRTWGVYCPKGWVPWRQFTDPTGNHIGRGCD
jgi:hypothetical protein